mmetsp:Transcript_21129/g.18627  ORF Transcript_21129/g.18627 Transcript_21129/m.18627 type:complete len:93 (+) Transcript_21129:80-358(+)|eukprot:CAMPEP_0201583870 /NCGR_PEP_ID=MMETSP0190_2-20130828/103840_1 /ASSEMBLY_ACC=CAM_ASM_000263 /TAXON_ID=37353 /ORGANISM="Rosalina sp." /LENGTH=92 /DNA_ID=CAMNT_0048026667 /DNA_START=60 /DNA_END=338 /DNA_ORIENTATION=+
MAAVGAYKACEDMDELKTTADAVKVEVEAKAAQDKKDKFTKYEVESGEQQVVAGKNYKIKIKVGDNRSISIKVYRSLPPQITYELKEVNYLD